MVTVLLSIAFTFLSAIVGGFFGAYFQHWYKDRNQNKVRDIAIRALHIFAKYAKNDQTYAMASDEFNNDLNVVEKRAVLVALCKLGIPVEKPVDCVFDITKIRFEQKTISKDLLVLMEGQVEKGNCDTLFFSDVDEYFSSNSRLLAIRAVAKKYVDFDLSKCTYNKADNTITHPNLPTGLFTPGEINVLGVFRARTGWNTYFDDKGLAIPEKMDGLKKEIDLGIWDTYLFWDWESYDNLQNQSKMANVFANLMLQNLGSQQKPSAPNA